MLFDDSLCPPLILDERNKKQQQQQPQQQNEHQIIGAALHRWIGTSGHIYLWLVKLKGEKNAMCVWVCVCRYRFVSLSGDLYENHIFFIRLFVPFSLLIEPITNVDLQITTTLERDESHSKRRTSAQADMHVHVMKFQIDSRASGTDKIHPFEWMFYCISNHHSVWYVIMMVLCQRNILGDIDASAIIGNWFEWKTDLCSIIFFFLFFCFFNSQSGCLRALTHFSWILICSGHWWLIGIWVRHKF